ncbi:armadillo-type protein [Suillus bovinus]|uniref:armadillo-type protein n=1 Tax=Suillus bovinus TaxID=48563 RepID=UPI001B86FA73|nr:armadillo-type protein [Suillus bovinus]KAG2130427.1 armadillo-type protein [Suillus bovinus]
MPSSNVHSANKAPMSQQGQDTGFRPVVPLELSANRWVPTSATRKGSSQLNVDSPKLIDRKVKALLDRLTMEKFETISNQIIYWVNRSVNEKDGRTLIQVIRLVFERAISEDVDGWSEMYARLCRKMMEQISPEVQDADINDMEGKPIAGGQLFRKYLLNRCQEDFERGWFANEAAAAAKASDNHATRAANDKKGTEEAELYLDEYYAAQKAKRQGLGLIKFIGELFKFQMITERIMHECVKKLLCNVENPEEEEIESLCQLLKTVGQLLDTPKARAHMDVYFTRMKESQHQLSCAVHASGDVIELRDRKWVSRNAVTAPTTIAAAAKEKSAAEKESFNRQISMSRGGSRRGDNRNQEHGPDGWAVSGGSSVPRAPSKAGDLSQFGKISKGPAIGMVMGPGGVFAAGKKNSKRETLSQTNSSSNMFYMLSQNPELAAEASTKPSRLSSRKPSVDLGHTSVPQPTVQRRKLQLLPRSVHTEENTMTPSKEEPENAPTSTAMSEADAKKKVDEDVKEFFAVRNLEEAEVYFTNLPDEHRFRLVNKLVASALESKEADARLVGEFFAQATSSGQCTLEVIERGSCLSRSFGTILAIDAPKVFDYMAIMLKGAGIENEPERLRRIASKLENSDKLVSLVA